VRIAIHGRAPAFASTHVSTSSADNAVSPSASRRLRVLEDSRRRRRVSTEHRQWIADKIDGHVVAAVVVEIAAADHEERDVGMRRRPGAQHVADGRRVLKARRPLGGCKLQCSARAPGS
jgi:hypothetical protein